MVGVARYPIELTLVEDAADAITGGVWGASTFSG